MKFRNLKADEIDVRIQSVKEKGAALLLYKDARCDMNILDETVGEMNWQRKHLRDNQNCIVSIWDDRKSQWIDKEDTGTESNTERQKGLASDSFKRSCFNWGIGRELYTSPFVWIGVEFCTIKPDYRDKTKYVCYDKFEVSNIETENGKIIKLEIVNSKTKTVVYKWNVGKRAEQPKETAPKPVELTVDPKPSTTTNLCPKCGSALVANPNAKIKFKCSTNRWNEELKRAEGCDYVVWNDDKPTEPQGIPDLVREDEKLSEEDLQKLDDLSF